MTGTKQQQQQQQRVMRLLQGLAGRGWEVTAIQGRQDAGSSEWWLVPKCAKVTLFWKSGNRAAALE